LAWDPCIGGGASDRDYVNRVYTLHGSLSRRSFGFSRPLIAGAAAAVRIELPLPLLIRDRYAAAIGPFERDNGLARAAATFIDAADRARALARH